MLPETFQAAGRSRRLSAGRFYHEGHEEHEEK